MSTRLRLVDFRYKFTTKFSPILIGLNRSRDVLVFISGETLLADSARLRKIPEWIVLVCGKFFFKTREHLVGSFVCLLSFVTIRLSNLSS